MIVVKFGGHAMKDENGGFAKAIAAAQENGVKLVVVHGGGPQIDAALKGELWSYLEMAANSLVNQPD